MAPTVIFSNPANNATEVRTAPAVIEIQFDGAVNRDLAETAFTIVPALPEVFTRWTTRAVNRPLPNNPTNLVMTDVLRLCTTKPFEAWKQYKLTLAKDKIKTPTGTAMAADYILNFKTRAQGVHVIPSTAVGGDSRSTALASGYKRAIVLSGGGAKGDFQVGALKYLYNVEGFYPDLVVGTSVGAINGAKLAEATTVAEHKATVTQLEQLWRSLRTDYDVFEPTAAYTALLNELGRGLNISIPLHILTWGLDSADEIEDKIERIMQKVDAVRKTSGQYSLAPLRNNWLKMPKLNATKVFASKVALSLGAVELYSGRSVFFEKQQLNNDPLQLENAIVASAVMPGVFEALRWGDKVYSDGGVRDVAGLAQALRQGATDIVVIPTYTAGGWAHQPRINETRYGTLESILGRALTELVFDEMLAGDINAEISRETLKNYYTGQEVRIRVVDPELEMHGTLNFNPEGIERGIQHGYDCAAMKLGGQPRVAVPHPVEQTRTSSYLVVDPKFPNGELLRDPRVIHEFDGGLSEPTAFGHFQDVRIIVREGTKILHAYPGDHLDSYGDFCVPGSDPDLSSPLNPFLKGRRKGKFYAFPLHSHNECLPISTTTNRRVSNLEVEVVYSAVNTKVYKEVRTKQNVTFTPDANGIHTMPFTLSANAPAGGKSRRVRLSAKKHGDEGQEMPTFVIHGAMQIPDIKTLTGFDGKGTNGRWECSRDAKWLPDMKFMNVMASDVKVSAWSQPNFTGSTLVITADSMIPLPWPIRSIKVEFV